MAQDSTRSLLEQADVDRDIAAVVNGIGRNTLQDAYNKGHIMTMIDGSSLVGYFKLK